MVWAVLWSVTVTFAASNVLPSVLGGRTICQFEIPSRTNNGSSRYVSDVGQSVGQPILVYCVLFL